MTVDLSVDNESCQLYCQTRWKLGGKLMAVLPSVRFAKVTCAIRILALAVSGGAMLLAAAWPQAARADPANTLCTKTRVPVSTQICTSYSTQTTGQVADRVCNANGVCNTHYRDLRSSVCNGYRTETGYQNVCRWSCRPGFQSIPGRGPDKGCFAGDALAKRITKESKNAKVYSDCLSIGAWFDTRMANYRDYGAGTVKAMRDFRNQTQNDATEELRSWDQLRAKMMADGDNLSTCFSMTEPGLTARRFTPVHVTYFRLPNPDPKDTFNVYVEFYRRGLTNHFIKQISAPSRETCKAFLEGIGFLKTRGKSLAKVAADFPVESCLRHYPAYWDTYLKKSLLPFAAKLRRDNAGGYKR